MFGASGALAAATDATAGKALLEKNCGRCHSLDATGTSPLPQAPPLREVYLKYPIDQLEEGFAEGMGSRHRDMPQIQFSAGSGRRHPQLSRQHHRRRPIEPAAGDHSGRDAALSHGGSADFTLRRAMQLQSIDWLIVVVYGVASLIIGLLFTKRAGRSLEQYFLSGRKLPWWLLGTSMVATTFSTDTPNLVTDLVRTGGVSMNWLWWAFLITGMLTVFFYAKLWRRSGALTDINFYELRYSGAPAAFLRGFRAIYLGVFFNVMIMATVTLAAIKIAGVLFGLDAHVTVVLAALITMVYSSTAGLWGVVVTDFFQFALAMTGSIAAAYYAVTHPSVGGLDGTVFQSAGQGQALAASRFLRPRRRDRRADRAARRAVVEHWYPGSEPGGGGYMAQRMLAARNEKQAMAATLWFNIAHYAVRPWPWILVALASLIVYPQLADIRARLPYVDPSIVGHDLAYPAMLVFAAARAARAGRGVAGGGLYVDDQHPPQLGRLLHRR